MEQQTACAEKQTKTLIHKNTEIRIFLNSSPEETHHETYNFSDGTDLDKEMFKKVIRGSCNRIVGLVLEDGSAVKPETVIAVNRGREEYVVINWKSSNRRERMDTLIPIKYIERIEFRSIVEF